MEVLDYHSAYNVIYVVVGIGVGYIEYICLDGSGHNERVLVFTRKRRLMDGIIYKVSSGRSLFLHGVAARRPL